MAYIECPSCGKTALSVASRCPHCGLLFSPGVIPPPEPTRRRGPWVVAVALVALAVVVMLARKQSEPRAAPPVVVVAPPARVEPPAPAPDSAVDSTPSPAAHVPEAAPPPAAPAPVTSAPVTSAPVEATPVETTPVLPTGGQLQRYASTWVNVRDRRGPDAAPVRVLDPGEAVLVDSLVGGWYRVVIDGQAIGYAYSSNLSERAP